MKLLSVLQGLMCVSVMVQRPLPASRNVVFYLLAALSVLLSILRFTQQVRKGQWFQRAGSRRPGIPERVRFL